MTKQQRKPILTIVRAKHPNYKAVAHIIIEESLKKDDSKKTTTEKEDTAN